MRDKAGTWQESHPGQQREGWTSKNSTDTTFECHGQRVPRATRASAESWHCQVGYGEAPLTDFSGEIGSREGLASGQAWIGDLISFPSSCVVSDRSMTFSEPLFPIYKVNITLVPARRLALVIE